MQLPVSSSGSRRRRAILTAARQAFLRLGYDASLDVIADDAGVARRTVFYNFGSKERLFREIIEEMSSEAMPLLVLDRTAEMELALLDYARTYVSLTVSPETLAIQRMLLSGAPNLLGQMRAVVERNYAWIVKELAAYFKEKILAREMRATNPDHAAERFLASVLGFARAQVMLGVAPYESDRDSYIREAVTGFVEGIRPRRVTRISRRNVHADR